MIVQNKMIVDTRKMEKECPQDSIIGPRAWVWCMDVVLNDLREYVASMCAEFIAYADDLACVINLLGTMRHCSGFRGCHLSERRATIVPFADVIFLNDAPL